MAESIKRKLISAKFTKRNAKDQIVSFKKGDIVELSENELTAFGDKFIEIEKPEASEPAAGTVRVPEKKGPITPSAPSKPAEVKTVAATPPAKSTT